MIEASIKVSNSESRLIKKFLIYDEDITVNHDNIKLKAYVDQSMKDFEHNGKPEDIIVILKMTW
jgi:hypothetical protein